MNTNYYSFNKSGFANERYFTFSYVDKFKTASLSDCFYNYNQSDSDPFWK